MRPLRTTTLFALALAAPLAQASAQDVEVLGERYGTRPPAAYFDRLAQDRGAFEFARGRSQRLRLRAARASAGPGSGVQLALGPREGPVVGDFRVPVLLGTYANTEGGPPFTDTEIGSAYFGGGFGTIGDYYGEVSGGRVTLDADVFDWLAVSQTDTVITGGQSGLFAAPLGGGGAGNFVYDLVDAQVGVDWGLYDNDGPDGDPNSGDDDGYVDVVAVMHPTRGGECGGGGSSYRIWSHRWSLSSAVGTVYETGTPVTGSPGDFIMIDDYTIQASTSCGGNDLNEIGVFTHELGHAFGLPDLYDTCTNNSTCPGDSVTHNGAGIWDLMSSGSWGCNNASPFSPCHMGAWSKEQLGWADIVTLAPDTDHGVLTLPPVESDGTIYRVDANDGSGEYFLLENRQRIGYDQLLFRPGLLVWHIDPDWILARWPSNTVNAYAHRGVWLRQADGLDELGASAGGRGDAADPFPGQSANGAFHAVSSPAAVSHEGTVTGVTLVDIVEAGTDVQLRLSTRFTTLTVRAEGSDGQEGLFTIDGQPTDPPETTFASAPFVQHAITAAEGESIAPGSRRPFVEWTDALAEDRTRTVVTPIDDAEVVARYGGPQHRLELTAEGGTGGVTPGSFVLNPSAPDLWFDEGIAVSVEAVPLSGFAFLDWTGPLAGQANPATATMDVPITAGASFELVYAVPAVQVDLIATIGQDVQLETASGTAPFSWRVVEGTLPHGLSLTGAGRILGASLDLGEHTVTVEAVDANQLVATGTLTLVIDSPEIPIDALVSPFLLSGPALTPVQLGFLDRQGNAEAGYDVGDFRAWLLANPDLPLSASFAPPEPRSVLIPLRFAPEAFR